MARVCWPKKNQANQKPTKKVGFIGKQLSIIVLSLSQGNWAAIKVKNASKKSIQIIVSLSAINNNYVNIK